MLNQTDKKWKDWYEAIKKMDNGFFQIYLNKKLQKHNKAHQLGTRTCC